MKLALLREGQYLEIWRDDRRIDEAIVRSLELNDCSGKVVLESLMFDPGQRASLGLVNEELGHWKPLFPGLFDEPCSSPKAPVLTFKPARRQAFVFPDMYGEATFGTYSNIACIPIYGVHVPFVISGRAEKEWLREVGEPCCCDGSCDGNNGKMINLLRPADLEDFHRLAILEAAEKFLATKKPNP